jgi:hypothetical protein
MNTKMADRQASGVSKRYEGRVKDGGILVSVHCDSSDEVSRAKEVLKATGAEDIASSGEKAVSTHSVETAHTEETPRIECLTLPLTGSTVMPRSTR